MLELLQYGFMQRALAAGIVVGILCPLIGIFIVLRRMSLIGDSLSHVALSGVAAGVISGIYPVAMALIFSIFAALAIEKLRENYRHYEELSIAIILSAGIGLAVVLISFARSSNVDIFGYLFGSITTVLSQDLYIILIIGLVVIVSVKLLYKELFYIAFDEEAARISGIPVKKLNLYFILIIAVTITLSMRIVGILLVSSLIVIPVAASLQIAKSFKKAALLSVVFGEFCVVPGIIISYYLEIASGGTIVILAVIILVSIIIFKELAKKSTRKKINS